MNKKDLEKLKRICDSIRTNDAKNFPQYVATPGTSPDIILAYLNRAKEALSYGSKKMAQKNADEAEQYIAKFEDLQDEFRTFMARYGEALAAAKHDLRFLRADIKAMKDSAKAKDADPLDKISKTANELWSKYTMKLKGSAPRYRLGATASGSVELTKGYTGPVVAKGNAAVEKFLRELIAGKRDSAKDAVKTSARLEELYPQFSRNTRISIVGKNGVYYSGVLKSVPDRFDKAQASEIEMKSDGSVIIKIKDSAKAKDVKVKQIARGIGWEIYYHDGRYYVDFFNNKPILGHKTLQGAKEELYYAGKIPSKTAELG